MLRIILALSFITPLALAHELSLENSEFPREPSSVPQKENIYPEIRLTPARDETDPKLILSGGIIYLAADAEVIPCPKADQAAPSIASKKIRERYKQVKNNDCAPFGNRVHYIVSPGEVDEDTKSCNVTVSLACGDYNPE